MPKATCSVDGCDKPHASHGFCNLHAKRWVAHGDPLKVMQIRLDDTARFWSKVDKDGPLPTWAPFLGPCWLWTTAVDKDGYGKHFVKGKTVTSHRYSYESATGSPLGSAVIDHLCRVRRCIRPDHLEPVTHRENLMRGLTLAAANVAKTHCPQGHEYTPENTYLVLTGGRACRTCMRDKSRRRRAA